MRARPGPQPAPTYRLAVGLGDFGRPDGYLRRQVDRWRSQWQLVATRELPGLLRLHHALEAEIPAESTAAIVHGDFRVDNTILDPEDARMVRAGLEVFPNQDALAEQYSRVSGRDLAGLPFHGALAFFKIAVIAEGIRQRHLSGNTVGPGFEDVGRAVPALVRAGLATLGLDPRPER